MEKGPRQATDVLLDLEVKIDNLLNIVKSQDLNIKVLSNKLNNVMELLNKQGTNSMTPSVEATHMPSNMFPSDINKQLPVSSDFNIPLDTHPQGFRRSSRPETYAGDGMYLPNSSSKTMSSAPDQTMKPPSGKAEVVVPATATNKSVSIPAQEAKPAAPEQTNKNSVPVMQRVVDKNSKSIFLADVEIIDLSNNSPVFKTRTNGTGKWMASLGLGAYRVIIQKRESLTKEKIEVPQDIRVDGSVSPLELPMLILK